MKTRLLMISCVLVAGLLALIAPQSAFAGGLHIHPVFLESDPPPPSSIHGGGNLQKIFEVAAKKWEHVFREGPDSWDITIEFEWAPIGGYAVAKFEEEGGTPVRPTRALVQFRNIETPPNGFYDDWYADPNPETNAAYEHYESLVAEVFDEDGNRVGEMNVGRVFSTETGPAAGRIDLLTIAIHEIGHALGLATEYTGNKEQIGTKQTIEITSPLPFAGASVYLQTQTHIWAFDPTVVMSIGPTPGWRTLITVADALVIAQLTSFENPDLSDPPGVPKVKAVKTSRLVLGPLPQTLPLPDVVQ